MLILPTELVCGVLLFMFYYAPVPVVSDADSADGAGLRGASIHVLLCSSSRCF